MLFPCKNPHLRRGARASYLGNADLPYLRCFCHRGVWTLGAQRIREGTYLHRAGFRSRATVRWESLVFKTAFKRALRKRSAKLFSVSVKSSNLNFRYELKLLCPQSTQSFLQQCGLFTFLRFCGIRIPFGNRNYSGMELCTILFIDSAFYYFLFMSMTTYSLFSAVLTEKPQPEMPDVTTALKSPSFFKP